MNEENYSTYSLAEIKSIIDESVQFEMWNTIHDQSKWDVLLNLQARLYEKFGISE